MQLGRVRTVRMERRVYACMAALCLGAFCWQRWQLGAWLCFLYRYAGYSLTRHAVAELRSVVLENRACDGEGVPVDGTVPPLSDLGADLLLRRLGGSVADDVRPAQLKYLLAMAVSDDEIETVDTCVRVSRAHFPSLSLPLV